MSRPLALLAVVLACPAQAQFQLPLESPLFGEPVELNVGEKPCVSSYCGQ